MHWNIADAAIRSSGTIQTDKFMSALQKLPASLSTTPTELVSS